MTDYWVEKYMKSLFGLGNSEIPEALQRLDMLTREESGMVVARNLKITHDVDDNVKSMMEVTQDVDGNVKAARELIQDVDSNVKVVDDNVKTIMDGAQSSLTFIMHAGVNQLPVVAKNSNERAKTYVTP